MDAQGYITNRVAGLNQDTMRLYDFICRRVDRDYVEVSRRLKEAYYRDARSLQYSVCEVVRRAAEKTCGSSANATVVKDKILEIAVGRAAETGESAKQEAVLSHTASRGAQAGAFKDRPSSGHGSWKEMPTSAMPCLPGAHDSCDHSGYGA